MILNFCTLFDSGYLDKGIVLYNSIKKYTDQFKLYVFAFDSQCEVILRQMALENMVVVGMSAFETEQLKSLKQQRSRAEYCWTCTPLVIQYVLNEFCVDNCIYIDADMMFFEDPHILVQELIDSARSVLIVKHRFEPANAKEKELLYGKYCVQFNAFLTQDKEAMDVLDHWAQNCLQHCSQERVDGKMGDQMYLDSWEQNFSCVHALLHLGGGVAPWNLNQYVLDSADSERIFLKSIVDENKFPLIFFHFQNIKYLPFGFVNMSSGTNDITLKNLIYGRYITQIEAVRAYLLSHFHGYKLPENRVTYNSTVKKLFQKYVRPFTCKNTGDIVKINRLIEGEQRDCSQ